MQTDKKTVFTEFDLFCRLSSIAANDPVADVGLGAVLYLTLDRHRHHGGALGALGELRLAEDLDVWQESHVQHHAGSVGDLAVRGLEDACDQTSGLGEKGPGEKYLKGALLYHQV